MPSQFSIELGSILKNKKLTISTAESCTGGFLAHLITSISGSSAYYVGSIISYTNQIKAKILNVSRESINKYTEVSGPVAIEMANGVRRLLNTDIGVATTGIAGPSGAMQNQPVGTVWIAVSTISKDTVRCFHFTKDRGGNIEDASIEALKMIIAEI